MAKGVNLNINVDVAKIVDIVLCESRRYEEAMNSREDAMYEMAHDIANKANCNVVIILQPHYAAGYQTRQKVRIDRNAAWVYTASKEVHFSVYNNGDGGYCNWICVGNNWIRYNDICHFYPESESTPFTPHTKRGFREYPERDWFNENQTGRCHGDYPPDDGAGAKHHPLY